MNRPKNARTTPWGRALMVRRSVTTVGPPPGRPRPPGSACAPSGKWLARHRSEGDPGLLDRPSRPRRSPPSIGAGWRDLIVRLRRCRMTAAEIARHLGLARSPVAAERARLGLNRLSALEPKAPVRRYQRARPGDLIHLDVKKLARFAKPGPRVTATRRGQNDGVGWEFVHVCIDDHARLAHGAALDDETGDTCARFLARAVVWFGRQGVGVRRVMTDHGTGYRSPLFRQAREALGCAASAPGRTRPRPTARPNASSGPSWRTGPMPCPTGRPRAGAASCRSGCATTTMTVLTAAWPACHPPLACQLA
jgi:hypothetical protein